MAQPMIEIKNLAKKYLISHDSEPYLTLRDTIAKTARESLPHLNQKNQPKKTREEFWALKNVSLNVKKGEVLGVIGKNGAGKSTLLKLLSRITPPTRGSITLRGRVASLLEVGTGFNPELTGKENIFLNGSILGMSQKEIKGKLQEIIQFSGIEKFIDTPVKRYSSGMYVRLAFAVAAHLEPEILLVDEVLAVGDLEFQKKCLNKLQSVTTSEGRTVIFVSHNMSAIKRLCNKCVLLQDGEITATGDPETVINTYVSQVRDNKAELKYRTKPHQKVAIEQIRILNAENRPATELEVSQAFAVEITCNFKQDLNYQNQVDLIFRNLNEGVILNTMDVDTNYELFHRRPKGRYVIRFDIPAGIFNISTLSLEVRCGILPKHNPDPQKQDFYDHKDNIHLNLCNTSNFASRFYKGERAGVLLMKVPATVQKL